MNTCPTKCLSKIDVEFWKMNLLFVILFFPFILFILKHFGLSFSRTRPLPPGPRPWPIIGNIPHIKKKPLHITITKLAKLHGPLMSLRLGTKLVVIASSPEAAKHILKNHDKLLSARSHPESTPYKTSDIDNLCIVWSTGNNDRFRFLRALFRTELFSAKALDSQTNLREKKVAEMLKFLSSKEGCEVDIGQVAFTTVFNTLSNVFFSQDFFKLENKGMAGGLKQLVWNIMVLAATPNIADYYPILAGFDLQGLRKKAWECRKDMFRLWEGIVKERRAREESCSVNEQDFLDVFLANRFTNDQINVLFNELLSAGTDTSTATIEWAMAELLRKKEVMEKLSEELKGTIKENCIKESEICQLPYLNACIKETLRLHPPVPFLIPHRALQTCEVMNYRIPKNSRVLVNVWAIGRDPAVWEDPLSFKPERFIGSNLDYKGNDFEFLPFGSGRRICPGIPMAKRQVPLVLASLIHYFDWSMPSHGNPKKLDMKEKFSITLLKEQPLLVIPRRK